MPINNVYTNSDGLSQLYGTERAATRQVGSPEQTGDKKVIIADIVWNRLEAFGTNTVLDTLYQAAIPAGAIITKANFVTITAFVSAGSATLDIGLTKGDGTELDFDGIDATIAKTAIDAVGETVTNDGALVAGAALTVDGYISARVGTANFTAGKGRLSVEYIIPA
jgi:hypothetical protein